MNNLYYFCTLYCFEKHVIAILFQSNHKRVSQICPVIIHSYKCGICMHGHYSCLFCFILPEQYFSYFHYVFDSRSFKKTVCAYISYLITQRNQLYNSTIELIKSFLRNHSSFKPVMVSFLYISTM